MREMERIASFINSFNKDDEGLLGDIYSKALQGGVPVVRRETRELLRSIVLMTKPKRILEVGTAVGYSALYLNKAAGDACKITTIELDDGRYQEACQNISMMGKEGSIEVIHGDASLVLPQLAKEQESYDLFFVDAAKGQYSHYFESVIQMAPIGSVIISDNVLQDGQILESHFLVEKRDRTIHDRMREYLYLLKNTEGLETSIVPIGDGIAITYVVGKM